MTSKKNQEDWSSGSKSSAHSCPDGASTDLASNNDPRDEVLRVAARPPPVTCDSPRVGESEVGSTNAEKRMSRKRKSWKREEETDSSKDDEAVGSPGQVMHDKYWRTLREVYTSARTRDLNDAAALKERKKKKKKRTAEPNAAGTCGLSTSCSATIRLTLYWCRSLALAENPLRAMVVHDPTLINAMDRLSGVLSKGLSELRSNETSATRHFLATLTSEVTEMRRRQENAVERMVSIGERHVKVMEGILQYKLRKEQRAVKSPQLRSTSPDAPPRHDQQ